jgi:hypothetical protein
VDAGGVIRHTQVGFKGGDEKKYEETLREILSKEPEKERDRQRR